jgi:curved DNA-binding protein CbpA
VVRGASRAEIATAYRRLAKRSHPDVGSATPSAMQDLNWAWNLLSNPARRSDWDRSHAGAGLAGSHWSAGDGPAPQSRSSEANWRTPPPWTVSAEPWAGAGAPAVAPRRSRIGCIGPLFVAFLLAAFVLFGALASPYPRQPVDGAAESQAQATNSVP